MTQRPLWQDLPGEPPIDAPIFRRLVTTELYVCPEGRFVERWREVRDSILFTAGGQMTENEEAAAYVLTRHQGIRTWYAAWRAHCPGPYQRELVFRIDAGYSHKSADTMAWRAFIKANRVIALSTVIDTRCLGGP